MNVWAVVVAVWLALVAYLAVRAPYQSQFKRFLRWLREQIRSEEAK